MSTLENWLAAEWHGWPRMTWLMIACAVIIAIGLSIRGEL